MTIYNKMLYSVPEGTTLKDAVKLAGMDYYVAIAPVQAIIPDTLEIKAMPQLGATYRTDSAEILSPMGVGIDYGIVQNEDIVSICECLTDENKDITLERLGAPGIGRDIYIVMQAPGILDLGSFKNDKDEEIRVNIKNKYVITSSHDGLAKVKISVTPVCEQNNVVLMTEGGEIRFRHTKKVANRLVQAKKAIRFASTEWETFKDCFDVLIKKKIEMADFDAYLNETLGESDSKRMENIKSIIQDLWLTKGMLANLPACRGTMFGAYMAFVEWFHHHRTVRKSKSRKDTQEAEIKSKILDGAKDLAYALHIASQMASI